MAKILILLAVVGAVLGESFDFGIKNAPDGKIVGGKPVDIQDYPHQVSMRKSGSHICGGSIISPIYIVTAAHCTNGQQANTLSIRAGSSLVNSGGVTVNVKKIHQHPNYNPSIINNDISILELSSSLTYSTSIQAIGLPNQDENLAGGTVVTVTGWGYLVEGGSISNQLQGVDVPIVTLSECQASYSQETLTTAMLCAGVPQGGKDACQGDSGGPLITNNKLYGIVSWGYGCARPGYPGVYSNVGTLRSFITQITGL